MPLIAALIAAFMVAFMVALVVTIIVPLIETSPPNDCKQQNATNTKWSGINLA